MSYATLAQLKAYLKIPTATETDDTLLQTFLDEASTLIDSIVGQPSAASALTTRYFDAVRNGRLLLFGAARVNGITAVVNGDAVTIPGASYVTEPRSVGPYWGIRLKDGANYAWTYTTSSEGAIAVTGYWAYTANADGSADALIVGACRALAAWMYREKDNVGAGADRVDGVTVVNAALPRNILDRLRSRKSML